MSTFFVQCTISAAVDSIVQGVGSGKGRRPGYMICHDLAVEAEVLVATFKPGQRVPDVSDKMGFFDDFSSLKISCGK